MITKDRVKHVADLARLAITEEEVDMFTEHLRSMAVYKDKLSEVHTDGVQPTTHGVDVKNVLRKDEPKQWLTQEEVLKNAPDQEDGQFRVPSILE
ncbi:MAG TPA: Asp-tRNA(Asn)/Glu-tRNA(Gln) amidotransferase subunit GatC [Bacillota bacterium]